MTETSRCTPVEMNGRCAVHHEGMTMNRLANLICLALVCGCVDSQDHGMRDDAGTDAFVMMDGMIDPDGGAVDSGGSDSGDSDAGDLDASDVDGGGEGPEALIVYIGGSVSQGVRTELIGSTLVPSEHTRWSLSISAANVAGGRETSTPTKTVGPCEYWPDTGGTWPPGTSIPGESVPLVLGDASATIDGRPLVLEESGGTLIARDDYVAGAEVAVTVRLATGTIRRTFEIDAIPQLTSPEAAPAIGDSYIGEYVAGAPLDVRWPVQYGADDRDSVLVSGGDAALWARCVLDHGDGQVSFPWADVQSDFIGSPGDMGNSISVYKFSFGEEVSEEDGVEVHVSQSRSRGALLYPPDVL